MWPWNEEICQYCCHLWGHLGHSYTSHLSFTHPTHRFFIWNFWDVARICAPVSKISFSCAAVGQCVISHRENWVWDICLMPSMLQFMPRVTFYKFSGIQGQHKEQGRNYQSLHFLVIDWTFKVVFLVLLRKKWGLYIHSHLVLCLGFFSPSGNFV